MSIEVTSDHSTTARTKVTVITPDGGRSLSAFGSTAQFKLEGAHTAGRLCLGLAVTPPGGVPPPHVHHSDDELFIVVEGEPEVWSDAGWAAAPAGSVVYLPRGSRHTFDEFYRNAAEIFAAGGAPDFHKLGTLAAKHG